MTQDKETSQFVDNETLSELKKLADEGDIEAKIEYATACIQNGIEIASNLSYLEEMAEQDNIRALINIGFVYALGVSLEKSPGSKDYETLIEIDDDKAEPYFVKAAELGSPYAMIITGHRAYVKCLLWYKAQNEDVETNDSSDEPAASSDDFVKAINWLTKGLECEGDIDYDLDYLPKVACEALSELYAMKCDINTMYDESKSLLWKKKANRMKNV